MNIRQDSEYLVVLCCAAWMLFGTNNGTAEVDSAVAGPLSLAGRSSLVGPSLAQIFHCISNSAPVVVQISKSFLKGGAACAIIVEQYCALDH
jgi:hypothetical protein